MNKLSITRDESTAVKGLLIILIILGHAQPLIHLPGPLRSFFYGFHVHCFMILPLLYPIKQLNKERIKNYVARLIVPYSLLFFLFFSGQLMMSIISSSSAVTSSPMDFVKAVIGGVYSMIMGGYFPLRDSIDVAYLWFLPAMFSLLIIRDYYMMASRLNKTILLSLGAIFYFLLWVCLYLPYFVGIKETIMYCSPFSVWQALGALFMGVTTITILEKAYSCNMGNTIKAVLLIAFVAMCAIYFMTPRKSVYWIIPNAFTPIIAFMFIYYFRDVLSRIRLFRKFGEHSFEIYIVQTPICILFYTIIPKLISVESVFVRILLTAVILAVCYYSAHVLLHVKIAKRLFFSRTWDDLTGKILSSGR